MKPSSEIYLIFCEIWTEELKQTPLPAKTRGPFDPKLGGIEEGFVG